MPDGAGIAPKASPRPPAVLSTLVGAIGEAAVLRMLELHGGTRIYIPGHKLSPKSGIGKELQLDKDACGRLQQLLGNDRYRVPLCRQWRAQVYRSAGLSYTQIARKMGVTDNAVWAYLRDSGMTNPQLSLDF